MFIDTHCHLSIEDYDDIEQVILENRKEGVSPIIISGCTKSSIIESLSYGKCFFDVFVTIGYHPSEASIVNAQDLKNLEIQLKNPKVVGIGEIGLDYHYGKDDREEQIKLFEYQLSLAEKFNLPVVIHSRDATLDTIQILKKYSVCGVIHCFSGSLETAKEYIKMGFVLGIGGVVTFKNSKLGEIVSQIPLEKIVLETDSPYLTPTPHRGEKNSSKYIPFIASKISDCKQVPVAVVAKITTETAKSIFHLD